MNLFSTSKWLSELLFCERYWQKKWLEMVVKPTFTPVAKFGHQALSSLKAGTAKSLLKVYTKYDEWFDKKKSNWHYILIFIRFWSRLTTKIQKRWKGFLKRWYSSQSRYGTIMMLFSSFAFWMPFVFFCTSYSLAYIYIFGGFFSEYAYQINVIHLIFFHWVDKI